MPTTTYSEVPKPRPPVTPPHISLAGLRIRLGLKQTDVCHQVAVILGKSFTKGALSAIETGHRGASAEVLDALHVALGLRPGDLVTSYDPSHSRRKDEAA